MSTSTTRTGDTHLITSDHLIDEDEINYYTTTTTDNKNLKIKWILLGFGWLTFVNVSLSTVFLIILCPFACIPCTRQLIRVCRLTLFPYSHFSQPSINGVKNNDSNGISQKGLYNRDKKSFGVICFNIFWILLFGWWIICVELLIVTFLYLTWIGKNFARRHLILLNILIMPFGVFINY